MRSNAPTARALFFSEAGRNLTMQLSKHTQATKKGGLNNNIAKHHLKTSHTIDQDSATCFIYSTDYYKQITLKS